MANPKELQMTLLSVVFEPACTYNRVESPQIMCYLLLLKKGTFHRVYTAGSFQSQSAAALSRISKQELAIHNGSYSNLIKPSLNLCQRSSG